MERFGLVGVGVYLAICLLGGVVNLLGGFFTMVIVLLTLGLVLA